MKTLVVEIKEGVEAGRQADFSIHVNESLKFHGWLRVPNDLELKKKILQKAHNTSFSIHPREEQGGTKINRDLREYFWWINMKNDIVKFIDWCLIHHKVKIEHINQVDSCSFLTYLNRSGSISHGFYHQATKNAKW